MNNKEQREVVCPICKVTHTIVHSNDPESVRKLLIWATKLFVRMKRGEKILLSMDCEGWKLGTVQKSLGLLQICEFLHENIFEEEPFDFSEIDSVNILPGFLIHFPASEKVIDILSGVLSNPNAILCTYDFTSDISSLMEAGVRVSTKSIFDAQLIYESSNPLTNTQVFSILVPAREMIGRIVEARDAVCFMSTRKGNMFDFLTFLHRNDADPFSSMVDEEFYKYAAGDLVMTALAALHSFIMGFSDITWNMTRLKVKEFLGLQKQYDKLLMPSAIRQVAFLRKYSLRDLQDYQLRPFSTFSDDASIRKALMLYVKADMIVNLLQILPQSEISVFMNINAHGIRDELEKSLEVVRSRILTLSPFDEDINMDEAQN